MVHIYLKMKIKVKDDKLTKTFPCHQIGRSSESPIDFVVMDTVAGDKSGDTKVLQSTISRFACRIIADRNDVNNCRIYAAGFDSSRNIFLGVSDRYFYRKKG